MHSQLQSPFFRLPAELRLEIYSYCLTGDDPIVEPLCKKDRDTLSTPIRSLPPLGAGLSATCQRIHYELDMRPLYTTNTFVFSTPPQITAFFAALPTKHKDLLTSITIDLQNCLTPSAPWDDSERHAARELAWFEYLACPTTHHRTRDDTPCATASCAHLAFDAPRVTHVALDARATIARLRDKRDISAMLGFLLRGTCAGAEEISAAETCRPELRVTLVPSGCQKTPKCWSCGRGKVGEPWQPAWLCVGRKAGACRESHAKVGTGRALPVVLNGEAAETRGRELMAKRRAGPVEFPQ